MLNVPYVEQINEHACGPAVLEMIYKYFGLDRISQEEIFDKYKIEEPHKTGNFRLDTLSLVKDAQDRGFKCHWGRINFKKTKNTMKILHQYIDLRIPIIVCQRFTANPTDILGHFRIIVGVNKNNIYLHDPHYKFGGPNIKWSQQKFMDYWQPTGQNVTGGVYVVIEKQS